MCAQGIGTYGNGERNGKHESIALSNMTDPTRSVASIFSMEPVDSAQLSPTCFDLSDFRATHARSLCAPKLNRSKPEFLPRTKRS